MKQVTHLLSGMAVGAILSPVTGSDIFLLMAVGAVFGSLPDMDLLLSWVDRRVHRSPASHSLLAATWMAAAWALLLAGLSGVSVLGFLSAVPLIPTTLVAFSSSFVHAAADSLTFHGCRLLYPLSRRVFRGPVRYDDLAANALLSALSVFLILLVFQMGPPSHL